MSTPVCVIVYNKSFEYPVNLEKKLINNSCGLSNQLIQIVNRLSEGHVHLLIDLFSTDFREGTMVPISTILDLERMNEKHGLGLRDVLDLNPGAMTSEFTVIPWGPPFSAYWGNTERFNQSARKLELSKLFRDMGSHLAREKGVSDREVNLVHLRIDWDFRDHCRADTDPYYDSIVKKYEEEILRHCDPSIPLCLLLDSYEHELVGRLKEKYDVVFITKEERNTYLPEKIQGKRDIYAFCDFVFAKNLKVNNLFILENSRETSSFSVMLKSCLDYNRVIAI
jgi:hypothetical protein